MAHQKNPSGQHDRAEFAVDRLVVRAALEQLDELEGHIDDDDWRLGPLPEFGDCAEVTAADGLTADR